ncbi:hypothetical protein RSPO_m00087 (plasmid) [Ralstonia solanacearum Po82]|uniref:Uncharacterized protein n=1 Tax=Ralstonia solanacearum (strain Po82) TaxID=1031711 RepID=F6G765_RALS8|nr:hypothetical protein RSPO_m00087 [Ralstonia solanacearum Po82]
MLSPKSKCSGSRGEPALRSMDPVHLRIRTRLDRAGRAGRACYR